jgi:hypothetical protein
MSWGTHHPHHGRMLAVGCLIYYINSYKLYQGITEASHHHGDYKTGPGDDQNQQQQVPPSNSLLRVFLREPRRASLDCC